MNQQLTRSCPLCDSNYSSLKKTFEEYKVVVCEDCGFLYVANPNKRTVSEEGVSVDRARHTAIPEPERRHHYTHNLLEMRCGVSKKILEIGAGYGPLGKLLESNGFEYLGFEPSEVRANIAVNGGLNVINDVYDPDAVNDKYDAIVLDNVIEHVRNPEEILHDAVVNLKNDGIVIGIVPSRYDLRRLYPDWNDTQFWIPHAHINFFRPRDLRRLYEMVGLEMKPFPSKAFGTVEIKDKLFSMKAIFEKSGLYPASLYTVGIKTEGSKRRPDK